MKAGIQLTILALVTVIIIGLVSVLTKEPIEISKQRMLASSLAEIVPATLHDEQWVNYRYRFQHTALGSDEALDIYPIIKDGNWNGAAVTAIAPNGYTGDIRLLIAINAEYRILGVRVLQHRETPGLGDAIERQKSDWITAFDGSSISTLTTPMWNLKKDGGAFDQFTGATITPRAVVRTVYRVLDWYSQEGESLLQQQFQMQVQTPMEMETEAR